MMCIERPLMVKRDRAKYMTIDGPLLVKRDRAVSMTNQSGQQKKNAKNVLHQDCS